APRAPAGSGPGARCRPAAPSGAAGAPPPPGPAPPPAPPPPPPPAPADPYSRPRGLGALGALPRGLRLGVPMPGQRLFFGDQASAAAYDAALARLQRLGAAIVEFDMEPFYQAARLLYEGPWVAERYLAARAL